MARASQAGLVNAAHDVSDGGLAQVLVESCLRRGVGARVALPGDAFGYLFSESAARALVAVPVAQETAFRAAVAEHGVACTPLGVTAAEPVLEIRDQFTIGLDELRTAHGETLRRLFGGPAELAGQSLSPVSQPAMPGATGPVATGPVATGPAATGPAATGPAEATGADAGLDTAAPESTQADS